MDGLRASRRQHGEERERTDAFAEDPDFPADTAPPWPISRVRAIARASVPVGRQALFDAAKRANIPAEQHANARPNP
jgi:hypothetical protein